MPQQERRFPRAPHVAPGQLDIVTSDKGAGRITVPVTIHTVSPGGVGVYVEGEVTPPRPRTRVTVRFQDGVRKFEIPGRVAWVGNTSHGPSAGVQFYLEAASSQMRRLFAHWVVSKVARAQTQPVK